MVELTCNMSKSVWFKNGKPVAPQGLKKLGGGQRGEGLVQK